jgi:DNA-binding transcriptional ArsR family regulator
MGTELTREELLAMEGDLLADLVNVEETLEWVRAELAKLPTGPPAAEQKRRYTKVTRTQVRDTIRKIQPATYAQIAEALNCSEGLLRYTLPPLYDEGMLLKVRKGGKVFWSIAKPQHPAKRKKPMPPRLKVVPGGKAVPKTGKQNVARRRRRGAEKGVKGQ